MDFVLDLYNFDSVDADGSRYVLTSPRSLEACSRLKIKPVQLLQKPLNDFAEENSGKSLEFIQILYNDWEEKRISRLTRCRQEREKIIMERHVNKNKQKKNQSKKNGDITATQEEEVDSDTINFPVKEVKHKKHARNENTSNHAPRTNSRKLNVMDLQEFDRPLITAQSPVTTPRESHSQSTLGNHWSRNLNSTMSNRSRETSTNSSSRFRSKSVDIESRFSKLKHSSRSLRSSSVYGEQTHLASGYTTPQIERDRRLIEIMKDRRKQEENLEKERFKKIVAWSKEKTKKEETKRKEDFKRQKELAIGQLEWERKLKEEEIKRNRELQALEKERLKQQEHSEALMKSNKEKQEQIRLQQIENRKKLSIGRKQQQEKSLNIVNGEVLAFQQATEIEIRNKLERAEHMKLENEVRELQKIKLMNKKQCERFNEIQGELKRRREEEEAVKREIFEEKLHKAEENYTRKMLDRELNMKNQGQQIQQKIKQTKRNQKRLEQQTEEHKQEIVEHKSEMLQKAINHALQNTQNKSIRAQSMRESSEKGWKRNLHQIKEKHQEIIQKAKENIEMKEGKVKRHMQLKEAAFEFSRVQAQINEAERENVKRKSSNFNQMAQKAKLTADIGRGPRSSFVNYSTIKLG